MRRAVHRLGQITLIIFNTPTLINVIAKTPALSVLGLFLETFGCIAPLTQWRPLKAMRFHPIALLFLLLTGPALANGPRVDDVCVGNETPGPFALSWSHIVPGTETVTVNGLSQIRGLDYTLDTDGGAITFTHSLPVRSAAEITYERDPFQSAHTGTGQTIPLTVDLLRTDRGYFSFQALGKPGDAAQSNLTLGVGLGWQPSAATRIATHFFFAPVTASSDAGSLSAEKRSGLSVAGTAGAGQWALFSFGFARAGVSLGDCGDSSIQAGQQTLSLSSRFTPDKQVQALVSYAQESATDDPAASSTAKTALSLTVTPTDKTQMQVGITQSETSGSGTTQAVTLSVQSQPSAKMQVSASYSGQDAPGTAQDSQTLNLKTVLTPVRTLSLETAAGQSQQGGQTINSQTVGLSLSPRTTLQIHAGLDLRQTEQAGKDTLGTAVASVSAAAKPLPFLEFSGSYKSRMASDADPNPDDLRDSGTARVALSPLPSVHLVATYAQNPDDGGASALQHLARQGVSLQTNFGALGLSGGCDWLHHYDTAEDEQTVHADLGLRFSAATNLAVGYQCRQDALDPTAPFSTAYTVGFTHSLGDRFSVSLSGKRQQAAASAAPDYNATANLGMKF